MKIEDQTKVELNKKNSVLYFVPLSVCVSEHASRHRTFDFCMPSDLFTDGSSEYRDKLPGRTHANVPTHTHEDPHTRELLASSRGWATHSNAHSHTRYGGAHTSKRLRVQPLSASSSNHPGAVRAAAGAARPRLSTCMISRAAPTRSSHHTHTHTLRARRHLTTIITQHGFNTHSARERSNMYTLPQPRGALCLMNARPTFGACRASFRRCREIHTPSPRLDARTAARGRARAPK